MEEKKESNSKRKDLIGFFIDEDLPDDLDLQKVEIYISQKDGRTDFYFKKVK